MSDFFDELPKTFIVSGGRTGTTFFAECLDTLVNDSLSEHEPDKIDQKQLKEKNGINLLLERGIWRLVVLKSLGVAGARNHSLNFMAGRINEETAIRRFKGDRKWIPKRLKLYIESNYQLFGMTKPLCRIPNAYLLFVVREPIDWIRSWMTKYWFSEKDLLYKVNILGLKRISPCNVNINESDWDNWNRQSKLAWVWLTMYSSMLDTAKSHPKKCRVVFFEDIFKNHQKDLIDRVLDYITHQQISKESKHKFFDLLSEKINASVPKKTEENPADINPELLKKIQTVRDELKKIADNCWE